MTETRTEEIQLPQDRPPDWANSIMRWALTTPGLQKMVGREVALIGFRGRRTGKAYRIPVSYQRTGDTITIVTKRQRRWWHNFESPIEVEMRLAGENYTGMAEMVKDDFETLDFMTEYLEKRPIDAKAYGLGKDERTRDHISRIVPHIVLIRVTVARTAG